ncbi:hypothetical protein AB3N04_01130 (plasmid) [Alkalihalophilus sp. As8PL]|uniref:TrbC/VIRB2 family protein n=1 Tax=Alkalihalophilus sp. As8PL TaxID=3237103 RepID=A0AB39BN50_9BACI
MLKKSMNRMNKAWLTAMALIFMVVNPSLVGANAFKNVDIGGDKVKMDNGNASGFFSQGNDLLYVLLGLAGMWVVACVIFAGVKLSAAQSNPQNRTQGFIGLAMACLGGFVVYKCLEIVGWIGGLGA